MCQPCNHHPGMGGEVEESVEGERKAGGEGGGSGEREG